MGSLKFFLLVFCFCKIKGKPVDIDDSGRLQCSVDVCGVISMFTLLSDIAFSTSPRIEKDRKSIGELMDYIVLKNDSEVFVNKMQSVFEWYLKDKSQYVFLSCLDALEKGYRINGLYNITVPGISDPLEVFCDQTKDGGGWLVFQRRKDGTVDFYRNWTEYKNGFGAKDGEFWIGNDVLHALTTASDQELRVDLTDFHNVTAYAKYTTFSVAAESDNYRLTVGGFSGSAGDSMDYHNGQDFSTQDRDNDKDGGNCAEVYVGAWWYNTCHHSNLNGLYSHHRVSAYKYASWYHWKKNYEALQKTEMKIKPKS